MKQTIPVLDLLDFQSEQSRPDFIKQVGDSLKDIGFFALKNHGIDKALIQKSYKLSHQFFSLSEIEKQKSENLLIMGQRGYTSYGRESAKDSGVADMKEYYHIGRDSVLPNIWPTAVDSFQSTFEELYRQLETCSTTILQAGSLYLEEKENYLPDMVKEGNNVLRLLHYPPVPQDRNPSALRAAAHEDINLITLLCESTDEGLELLQKDGTWLPIHALEGQIIIDAGDMLQELTGGLFKSTTHRVVNPNNNRSQRFSMPYFVHPRSEVVLSDRYTAGQFLNERLREMGL